MASFTPLNKKSKKELSSIVSNSFLELLSNDSSDSWEQLGEKNGVHISKKTIRGTPINCMKGTGLVHASPKEVFDIVNDIGKLTVWYNYKQTFFI